MIAFVLAVAELNVNRTIHDSPHDHVCSRFRNNSAGPLVQRSACMSLCLCYSDHLKSQKHTRFAVCL